MASRCFGFYLECQIHGDILFNTDIEALVVSATDAGYKTIKQASVADVAREFASKNGCRLVFLPEKP
jgi:hypothetical protein